MNNSSLICTGLSKYFSHRLIFSKLELSLLTGSSVGITGKNGSGKSTLIKIVAGLISATSGNINFTVNNKALAKEDHFKYLGMMSPYLSLYDELTGYENLEFFLNLKSPSKAVKDKAERINYLLENVGLFKRKNDMYKNYSSGMKQRLKLAFALLNEPLLLLLDEPCANLDTEGIDVVYRFSEEQRNKGMLIVATNEASDLKLCDTLINIDDHKN